MTVQPPVRGDSIQTVPPCFLTMACTMVKPKPHPLLGALLLGRKIGVKNLLHNGGGNAGTGIAEDDPDQFPARERLAGSRGLLFAVHPVNSHLDAARPAHGIERIHGQIGKDLANKMRDQRSWRVHHRCTQDDS